jgi:peptidoglycan/LPS O-acetylase OafA/YrhL
MTNSTKRQFHTFDALRFFSFLIVFISHVPAPEFSFYNYISKSGSVGVSFFFVLSGFLITYILLFEKKINKKINLKDFFARRILRIWPLFYIMILFAFLTPYILNILHLSSSSEGYNPNWLVSSLFLENYKMMITNNFPNVSPLRVMWSICVEEHFYIIWGLAIYFIPIKKVNFLIISSILIGNITRVIYFYKGIDSLDIFTNIDYFAYGAIPALVLVKYEKALDRIEAIPIQIKYLFTFFTVAFVFIIPNINFNIKDLIYPLILGLLFAFLISCTITNKANILISDKSIFSKLGKYTYGLYLFHTIVINLFFQLCRSLHLEVSWYWIGLISLCFTIILSYLSYNYFELFFLNLKKRYNNFSMQKQFA